MLTSAVQPGIISLFSSTGSDPLQLFSQQTDLTLCADSFIHLLHDASSTPSPPPPAILISTPSAEQEQSSHPTGSLRSLDQTVLHLQSPTLATTFIRSPPRRESGGRERVHVDLGLKKPWMHMQVRNLGRPWSFEVGVVDQSGHQGVVRCSTFQRQPKLTATSPHRPPLLHLPLSFPSLSPPCLTAWCTIALNLSSLLSRFSAIASTRPEDASCTVLPTGRFDHVTYVKVYATCRLRRIWFSDHGAEQQNAPWEFGLFGEL